MLLSTYLKRFLMVKMFIFRVFALQLQISDLIWFEKTFVCCCLFVCEAYNIFQFQFQVNLFWTTLNFNAFCKDFVLDRSDLANFSAVELVLGRIVQWNVISSRDPFSSEEQNVAITSSFWCFLESKMSAHRVSWRNAYRIRSLCHAAHSCAGVGHHGSIPR